MGAFMTTLYIERKELPCLWTIVRKIKLQYMGDLIIIKSTSRVDVQAFGLKKLGKVSEVLLFYLFCILGGCPLIT